MAVSITNESKNSKTITNEQKGGQNETWGDMTGAWDDYQNQTWAQIGKVITKESKNNKSITNESK